jgi:hypothetical protein
MITFDVDGTYFKAIMDESIPNEPVLAVYDVETGEEVSDLYIVSIGYEEYFAQTELDKL